MNTVLNTLFDNRTLSRSEAREALIDVAAGNSTPTHIAAFITVFLLRRISANELSGFRDALLELCTPVDLSDYDPLDMVGTGGDNKNTFNISTLSCFVAAGAGVTIAKHGNYAVSSSCGSSNVLEQLGYRFPASEEKLKADIEKAGICFLHAPLFHPALKNVAAIRKELKVRTFFNMLGPIINPARPSKQVLGVYSNDLGDLYAEVLKASGIKYSIIHSIDGYDEISLTGSYRVITNDSDRIIDPAEQGLPRVTAQSISGGDTIEESAKIFTGILNGSGTREQNEVVAANAAAAISLYYPQLSTSDSIEMARESLLSKKALNVLNNLLS